MKTKLITSLRLAANALENGTWDYDWENAHQCNCGVLVSAITGKSSKQIEDVIDSFDIKGCVDWARIIGTTCPVTGWPVHEMLVSLFEAGLSAEDIVDLEDLNNEAIRRRAGIHEMPRKKLFRKQEWQFDNERYVIAYMRAWADMLTEEGQLDSTSLQSSHQTACS